MMRTEPWLKSCFYVVKALDEYVRVDIIVKIEYDYYKFN